MHTVRPQTNFLDAVLTTASWLPETRNHLCFVVLLYGCGNEFLHSALGLKRAAVVLQKSEKAHSPGACGDRRPRPAAPAAGRPVLSSPSLPSPRRPPVAISRNPLRSPPPASRAAAAAWRAAATRRAACGRIGANASKLALELRDARLRVHARDAALRHQPLARGTSSTDAALFARTLVVRTGRVRIRVRIRVRPSPDRGR